MLTFSCRSRKGDKRTAPACRAQRGAGRPLKRRRGSGRGDSASLEWKTPQALKRRAGAGKGNKRRGAGSVTAKKASTWSPATMGRRPHAIGLRSIAAVRK